MKYKVFALALAFALGICTLSACSNASAPPSPADVSDTLFAFIDKEYPNDYTNRDGSPGKNGYKGYVLNAGVVCYTNQDENGALTKAGVTIDMSLATGDRLSSGAGCFSVLINTIDPKQADSIAQELGLASMPTGVTTASGSSGTYTYGSVSNSILLRWEANSTTE